MLMHEEKKLRARMRWLALVGGLILVTGIGGVLWRVNKSRGRPVATEKPLKVQNVEPPR